ncbi:MAG: hypothetical protein CMI52_02320 [Parcubacteria group bacterium]|nr:hypothetical protein [Parcubacteria group bacterium]|tara:strand:+ start:380 stop:1261 length:882 start_codon:yes stop_codon:yes gene_type:complete
MAYTVGILGSSGYVGGSIKRYFQKVKAPLKLYDKYKEEGSVEEINQADVVFVAVPTPYKEEKGGFDLSIVREAISLLVDPKIIVIKSTILPGTTNDLQKEFPQHRFLFNPEFLTQSTAEQDMAFPDRQLMGYTDESYSVAGEIMRLLPLAPFEKIMPAKEAEMIKYFNNTWFATKVVFANQIFDLCEKLDINYEIVRECAAMDKRVGPSHLDVLHGGYRGYGGACLPKDTQALIQLGEREEAKMTLLKEVERINLQLQKMETTSHKQEQHTDNGHVAPELKDFELHLTQKRGR